jgi:dihydrofolate reductase
LIDELHLAVSPVLLGRGESLFQGIDLRAKGYEVAEHVVGHRAMHVFIRK